MSAPSIRRNGKPPACEPCRKSRLRCDHVKPSCGRCNRRRITEQCIYHPAPMTRNFAVPSQPSSARQASTSSLSSPVQSVARHIQTPPTPNSDAASPASTPITGFLGLTSYAAVFTEQQADLDISLAAQHRSSTSHPSPQQRTNQDHDRVLAGARLLSMFRDLPLLTRLVEHWYRHAHGLPILAPVVRTALESLRVKYSDILNRTDNDALLASLSEKVFQNTSLPIKVSPYISAREYASLFVDDNLRWEILGIIVTLAGAAATSLTIENPLWIDISSARNPDRKQFVSSLIDASNTSLSLITSDGEANDLLAWLIYDNFMLMTVHHGDSSSIAWIRLGELATAIFAMGLHQPLPPEGGTPIFLAEARKIFIATVYVADKEVCTFLGRPPRISRRYCACQLPLDLSEDEVQLEGDELQRSLDKLDEKGWNRHPSVRRTGYIRIRMLTSFIREDILEISLGSTVDDLAERAQDISKRSKEFYDNLPSWFRYSDGAFAAGKPMLEHIVSVIIHLDYLYSDFLIQRTLIRRAQVSSIEILTLATQLLSTVLSLAAVRDQLGSFQSDLSWEIAYYGLPAAGVLAVDLLRQHHEVEQRYDDNLPSRSDTIQNLSVFISCLEWVARLGIGNHVACSEAKVILKRILDRILLPPPRRPIPSEWVPASGLGGSNNGAILDLAPAPSISMRAQPGSGDSMIGFKDGSEDIDFMTWLDNMDLDVGNWINFNALWDSTGMVSG